MKYLLLITFASIMLARTARAQGARILEVENIVQTAKGGGAEWTAAAKDQLLTIKDRIRTPSAAAPV